MKKAEEGEESADEGGGVMMMKEGERYPCTTKLLCQAYFISASGKIHRGKR